MTWEVEAPAGVPNRVLPDGHVDLVWLPGADDPLVAGPATRPVVAQAGGHRVRGLRFRDGAAAGWLGVAAHEVRDLTVRLADLGPRRIERAPDPVVGTAAAVLRADPSLRVAHVAASVGLSERHLRRRFRDWIGYGPKRYARVCRLQRALALGLCEQSRGARLAVEAGYADQAHLAREVRELAGVPFGVLLAERGRIVQDAGGDR